MIYLYFILIVFYGIKFSTSTEYSLESRYYLVLTRLGSNASKPIICCKVHVQCPSQSCIGTSVHSTTLNLLHSCYELSSSLFYFLDFIVRIAGTLCRIRIAGTLCRITRNSWIFAWTQKLSLCDRVEARTSKQTFFED